jgi:hypothetical protein
MPTLATPISARAAAVTAAVGALALLPATASSAPVQPVALSGESTLRIDLASLPPVLADAVVGEDGLVRLRLEGNVVTVDPDSLPPNLARALRSAVYVSGS